MHTVLIDDDPTAVFLTKLLFQRGGLPTTLTTFSSPVEALAFLTQQAPAGTSPQVILLDLNMPLLSGWEVLDALRPLEAQLLGHCAVYILTSSVSPCDQVRAHEYPLVAGLLQKPLTQPTIQAIHAPMLASKQA